MDLVAASGVDVTSWARSKKGLVKNPASNPSRIYEWAFVEPQKVVVVNLWYEEIEERSDILCRELNMRKWSDKQKKSKSVQPASKSAGTRRAENMEVAIANAYRYRLPVRVIVIDGPRRDYADPSSQQPSRVERRLLDDEIWSVSSYDQETGDCFLVRGVMPSFTDQFSTLTDKLPEKVSVTGEAWKRDPQVRTAVLLRAKGICELCGCLGFATANGEIYLETHHVIPLSESGMDNTKNVVAICANDHREAHHGRRKDEIRNLLLNYLSMLSLAN
jgi:5-methylcytosine-specific restriction protein A